jgi:hypothetical protein
MQGGTGTSYAHSGETTEWEDILIKKGITSKEDVLLSKGLNPEDVSLLLLVESLYAPKHASSPRVNVSYILHLTLLCIL